MRPAVPETAPNPATTPDVTTNAGVAADIGATATPTRMSVEALTAAGVDVAVDPQTALASLQRANRATGRAAVSELSTRMEATANAMAKLRAGATADGAQVNQALLDQATADLRSQETMLRQALANAARATNDAEWRQAQTQLATQYQLYAQAVRRAQSVLRQ